MAAHDSEGWEESESEASHSFARIAFPRDAHGHHRRVANVAIDSLVLDAHRHFTTDLAPGYGAGNMSLT
jgi:hypothetical protein